MANPNAGATQREQLVEVTGIPGYMTTKTGGDIESETSKSRDGGSLKSESFAAPSETSDVVVSKIHRPRIHGPILKVWGRQVGMLRTTIKIWDTDPDLGPIGEPTVYADALLKGLKRPEFDANGGDVSMFELTFAVDQEA
jgi:hypothetical protein